MEPQLIPVVIFECLALIYDTSMLLITIYCFFHRPDFKNVRSNLFFMAIVLILPIIICAGTMKMLLSDRYWLTIFVVDISTMITLLANLLYNIQLFKIFKVLSDLNWTNNALTKIQIGLCVLHLVLMHGRYIQAIIDAFWPQMSFPIELVLV